MTNYMRAVDVAKLMRADLKANFPGVKFGVRTSAGKTLNIEWTDGPPTKAVSDLTDKYSGEGFDGMTDMRYGRDAGTTIDGVRYEYLTDFVFCQRHISPDTYHALRLELARAIAAEAQPGEVTVAEVLADRHYWEAPHFYYNEVDRGPWEASLYQFAHILAETRAVKAML